MYARRLIDEASLETMTAASLSHHIRTGCLLILLNERKRITFRMKISTAAAEEAAKSSAAAVSTAVEC